MGRFQGLRRWKLAISFSGFPRMEKRDSVAAVSEGAMRPKKHETTGSGDLFRAQLDQIINMRHELVQLAGKIDWDFIDGEDRTAVQRQWSAWNCDTVCDRAFFASSIFTACPTTVRASAGSLTRISSTSLERSSSNTSFRTSART